MSPDDRRFQRSSLSVGQVDDFIAERDTLRLALDEAVRALHAIRPLLPRVLHGDADVVDIGEIVLAALARIREIVPDAGGEGG